jgi:lysozyme
VTFSWSSVAGATHYWITVATSDGTLPTNVSASTCPACVVDQNPTGTSYTATLAPGTYYWEVQAWANTSPIQQGQFSLHRSFIVPTGGQVWGVDLSNNQGTIDWSQVAAGGASFAFIKATQRTDFVDPYFQTNMNEAAGNGLLAGAYHYACPVENQPNFCFQAGDPVAEAHHFLSVAGPYITKGWLRPVLDVEEGASLGPDALSTWVTQWAATIERETGVAPIIYTSSSYAGMLNATVTRYPLWVANWGQNDCNFETMAPPSTGVWNSWAFWQYCSTGSVPGVSGDVDLDLFSGDLQDLQVYVIP